MTSLPFISSSLYPHSENPTLIFTTPRSKHPFITSPLHISSSKSPKPLKLFAKNNEKKKPPTSFNTEEGEEDEEQVSFQKAQEALNKLKQNPSREASVKLLREALEDLDSEDTSSVPILGVMDKFLTERLESDAKRLEKAETLDLQKVKRAFGVDTFYATEALNFGNGGVFRGNLRKPIEEVMPILERKLSEAAGIEVVFWLLEDTVDGIKKQGCMVQPKSEIDYYFECKSLNTPWGYIWIIILCIATFGTIAWMSVSFLKPDATLNDYVADVIPLLCGFLSIFGVSEIVTRVTAARYGVKLSPSIPVPSTWTGCLGIMNDYASLLPNNKAVFDIPVARAASAYLTSGVLAVAAFVANGSFNGGDNALYVNPQFFFNNPLLSSINIVIGPYADDLGNVSPHAIEGIGVPVDPVALAGLLGIVVTSLNLLPSGRLEGGRIAQALFGVDVALRLSYGTTFLLLIGALKGSLLCLVWGLFTVILRREEEILAKDTITPLGYGRYGWGLVLAIICFFTLFPYSNMFSSSLDPLLF